MGIEEPGVSFPSSCSTTQIDSLWQVFTRIFPWGLQPSMAFRLNNYDGRRSPRTSTITIYEFERRDESSRILVGLEFHTPACRAFTVEIDVNNPAEVFQPIERTKIAIGHPRGPVTDDLHPFEYHQRTPLHCAGTTIVHGCGFFTLAAASRHALNTAWLRSTRFISFAKVAHPSGLVDFISAIPAFQRSVCKMVAATSPFHPNGNARA